MAVQAASVVTEFSENADREVANDAKDQEQSLVERAQSGDQAAFGLLYEQHKGRVYALCLRLCGGDAALADEQHQDAFVRAWDKLHLFKGDSAFGTWLHRVTVNVVLSDKRVRMRDLARRSEEAIADVAERPEGRRSAAKVLDLEAAIAKLPQRARAVLVLHDIEGYKHKEIAELTDMAEGSSKAQLHRARQLLRDWLAT